MNEDFIHKVKELILKHLHDETFDVSSLALKLGYSRTQLYRKVKFTTGKSVNRLIRETRLQEAAKLIKSQDLTASEVAYRVGYKNPQYFNKCFHDYFGLTPIELKNKPDEEVEPVKRYRVKNVLILVSILIVMLFVFGYQFTKNDNLAPITKDSKSIVILPFTDLTKDRSEAWWCFGIREQIINKFSLARDLVVVEGPSSESFIESGKTITEIIQELEVDHALTGSIRHNFDSIFVTVRLINANGINLWNHTYKSEDTSDFYIQQDIANQVLYHLKVELSQDEKAQFEKRLSENFEANQYFKKGLFYQESREIKDIKKSIKLFKEAINLDPSFTDAYAYLGNMYAYSTADAEAHCQFMDKDSARTLALLNLNHALKLDPNCFISFLGLAELYMSQGNNSKAKEYFDKALEISPNHAQLNQKLANLYNYLSIPNGTDKEKFLFHIKKAYEGKPTNPRIILKLIIAYLYNGDIQSAEKYYAKKGYLLSLLQDVEIKGLINSYKYKDFTKVIESYENGIKEHPNDPALYIQMAQCYRGIAVDRATALTYAEKAYQLDSLNRLILKIYYTLLIENKKTSKAIALKNRLKSLGIINGTGKSLFLSQIKFIKGSSKGLYLNQHQLISGSNEDALKFIMELPEEYFTAKAGINFLMGDSLQVAKLLKDFHHKRTGHNIKKFALLKQRDSMYYYLDRVVVDYDILLARNRHTCYDLYRHEPRYKSFLRKNYLPISEHYNNLLLPVVNSQHKVD